jgi:hypothetical protein
MPLDLRPRTRYDICTPVGTVVCHYVCWGQVPTGLGDA